MKPIIIFKEKNKNNKLEFTEEELTKLLEQAYNQGYEDGKPSLSYPSGREKFLTITPPTTTGEIKTIQCPHCGSRNTQYMHGIAISSTAIPSTNKEVLHLKSHYTCADCHEEFEKND